MPAGSRSIKTKAVHTGYRFYLLLPHSWTVFICQDIKKDPKKQRNATNIEGGQSAIACAKRGCRECVDVQVGRLNGDGENVC